MSLSQRSLSHFRKTEFLLQVSQPSHVSKHFCTSGISLHRSNYLSNFLLIGFVTGDRWVNGFSGISWCKEFTGIFSPTTSVGRFRLTFGFNLFRSTIKRFKVSQAVLGARTHFRTHYPTFFSGFHSIFFSQHFPLTFRMERSFFTCSTWNMKILIMMFKCDRKLRPLKKWFLLRICWLLMRHRNQISPPVKAWMMGCFCQSDQKKVIISC